MTFRLDAGAGLTFRMDAGADDDMVYCSSIKTVVFMPSLYDAMFTYMYVRLCF